MSDVVKTFPGSFTHTAIPLLALAAPLGLGYLLSLAVVDLGEPVSTIAKLALMWVLAMSVLVYVTRVEKRPLTSVGLKLPTSRSLLLAIGLGIVLSLLVPLLTLLGSLAFPASESEILATSQAHPVWILLLAVLTAAFTEELLFRAFPLERLQEVTGNPALPLFLSVAAFVALHLTAWNTAHVIFVVLPMAIVLGLLYLWKRNLIFVAVVHLMVDLPLVVAALFA